MNHPKIRLALALLLLAVPGLLRAQRARELASVSVTVSDLDRALDFYTRVLPFRMESRYELQGADLQQLFGLRDKALQVQAARLRLGTEQIELMEIRSRLPGRPLPADSRSNDRWFQHIAIVVSDMDRAWRRLDSLGAGYVSTLPQTLPAYLPAAAGISAFYFRDPDGHVLELIHFPPGKGDPRWQAPDPPLFQGIDHTAIGISQTAQRIGFYETAVGLQTAGRSRNYGPEQEHLNQVFGAHLLITGLRAQTGPGLEFLEYLAPPGGRPYPEDSRVADLWHWHTHIRVDDPGAVYAQVKAAGLPILSAGIVAVRQSAWPFSQAFMFRDPDGHAILISN